MPFPVLLSIAMLAASAMTSPLVNVARSEHSFSTVSSQTVALKARIGSKGGLAGLLQKDLARVKAHQSRHHATSDSASFSTTSVPLSNYGSGLTAEVGVGTPPTIYQLVVDTGSSNTFVGANKTYVPTSSSNSTGNSVTVGYGGGAQFSGTEFMDTVTIGNMSIHNQSIGVANSSQGFFQFDGILGLGPDDMTIGTVQNTNIVPTVTDNLAMQGTIQSPLIGLFIPPTTSNSTGPSLSFGMVETSKFSGDLNFVPTTNTSPSSLFWGIDQSISYGNQQILPTSAGIVDSGTTLMFLASDAFDAYTRATGATMDQNTGLLTVDNVNNLQSLFLNIGEGTTLELNANAQIFPRQVSTKLGGDPNTTYLIVASTGTPSGQGLDFINGFTMLQRFYSVYDSANSRVGFATTPFTNATSN